MLAQLAESVFFVYTWARVAQGKAKENPVRQVGLGEERELVLAFQSALPRFPLLSLPPL